MSLAGTRCNVMVFDMAMIGREVLGHSHRLLVHVQHVHNKPAKRLHQCKAGQARPGQADRMKCDDLVPIRSPYALQISAPETCFARNGLVRPLVAMLLCRHFEFLLLAFTLLFFLPPVVLCFNIKLPGSVSPTRRAFPCGIRLRCAKLVLVLPPTLDGEAASATCTCKLSKTHFYTRHTRPHRSLLQSLLSSLSIPWHRPSPGCYLPRSRP